MTIPPAAAPLRGGTLTTALGAVMLPGPWFVVGVEQVSGRDTDPVRPRIDHALVRGLIDRQFPQWSGLSLHLVDPAGSDHVIYRLGEGLAVRLPRHQGPLLAAEKEARWLPRLASRLPLPIPVQVAMGQPDSGYPWPWSVVRWLPGEVATTDGRVGESVETAHAVAEFLIALQQFAPAELPPGKVTEDLVTERPLSARDRETRAAIAELKDVFPALELRTLWDGALAAPGWGRSPVWFHGDLHAGNLLSSRGRISAVIDFGALGIGDPSCDVAVAFGFMSAPVREVFRRSLGVDEATWARARGWAIAGALNAYTSYAAANPRVAARTGREITDALHG